MIELLLNETLISIKGMEEGSGKVSFFCASGKRFDMYHEQDCCEDVLLEEIIGDPKDLIGARILLAEETISEGVNPLGVTVPECQDSFTWTFYRIGTIKGDVTLRWYGESNGYYSEKVEFGQS